MKGLKASYSDYTESEFLELIRVIFYSDTETEEEHLELMDHFVSVTGQPAGTDVTFYPEPEVEDSPEGILGEVKRWRTEQGLPGFKN